jgi:tyrosinase
MSPAPDREPKDMCRWVQRDPVFYTDGEDRRHERERKFRMVRIFQQQVVDALKWPTFSQPQGDPGYPWANITVFNPPQPDALYPNRTDFDGLLEQPHDNWHGWIGYDMADNAYTAFDPIFWSYHSCIDRIFEMWLRAHPAAMFTSGCPIQPFAGPEANRILLSDPHRYLYTRIGDMARDSRAIGYDYGAPVHRDFTGETPKTSVPTSGSSSITARSANAYVVFDGISCVHDSYIIDVFLNQADPGETDVDPGNPHYVGRLTRIGMGVADDKGRCIRHTVTRVLNATAAASRLGVRPGEGSISQLVTDVTRRTVIAREDYLGKKGFEGCLVWGEAWPGGESISGSAVPAPQASTSCCH